MKFGSGAQRLLHDMPSNAERPVPPASDPAAPRPRRKLRRRILIVLLMILSLPLLLAAFVKSGLISPLIEDEAVAALSGALPESLSVDIGDADVIVEGLQGVGVSLGQFVMKDRATGKDVLEVDRTRIGVTTLSALRGKPQLQNIEVSGIRLNLANARSGSGELPAIAAVETGLDRLLDFSDMLIEGSSVNGSAIDIKIGDMTVTGHGSDIFVRNAVVIASPGQRAIEAEIEIDGRTSQLSGMVRRSIGGALIARFRLDDIALPFARVRTLFSDNPEDHLPGATHEPVRANVVFTARRTRGDAPDQLTVSVEPTDFAFKLDDGDLVPVTGRFNLAWTPETKVFSLRESRIRYGRSSAVLTGGVRDAPGADGSARERAYQFELIANNGVSNPIDSPERAVQFAARAIGTWTPRDGVADISHIELESEAGSMEGAGTFDFSSATPTAIFAISVEDFALAGVKQFWPAPVARGARRWVLSNLAGGRVTEGEFLIAEPLRRRIPGTDKTLQGDTELSLQVEGVRFDVTGGIPPVRDAIGRIDVKGGDTVITLESGTTYMPSGRTAEASSGVLIIHQVDENGVIYADLDVDVSGTADALGELISFRPINAQRFRPYKPEELSGEADARVIMRFALNPQESAPPPKWEVELDIQDAAISTPFDGRMLADMTGRININQLRAQIDVTGEIDGVPANISMTQPFGGKAARSSRDIILNLNDADRTRIAPGLETLVDGITSVNVKTADEEESMEVEADLSQAKLSLPWIGWAKGTGIPAKTVFDLVLADKETRISNFQLDGGSFFANGDITVSDDGLQSARFGKVRLNETDDISVDVTAKGKGFAVSITGKSFDARSLIRHVREQLKAKTSEEGVPVDVTASIAKVTGFGDEYVRNLRLEMRYDGKDVVSVVANCLTASGFPISATLKGAAAKRTIQFESLDAGEALRFLDIYGQVRGGIMTGALKATGEKVLSGSAEVTDFRIFNEPRLNALVSSKSGGSESLKEAIKQDIDTREIKFDRAEATVIISPNSLQIRQGVIRGPLVGSTFRGTLYDKNDRMRITGTFMPAYAVNSLLAGIPIVGLVLGNGRDRGLIGVTYMLEGDMKKPKITVNPLSVIAPGVFRQIFEFR
ncbi:DUF3971 domain-containing protein [Oricola indica]|uniref:YhdP family protein n=1 Tax=Oricola indica TaxID=2872591 RepID=UPI003CCC1330